MVEVRGRGRERAARGCAHESASVGMCVLVVRAQGAEPLAELRCEARRTATNELVLLLGEGDHLHRRSEDSILDGSVHGRVTRERRRVVHFEQERAQLVVDDDVKAEQLEASEAWVV